MLQQLNLLKIANTYLNEADCDFCGTSEVKRHIVITFSVVHMSVFKTATLCLCWCSMYFLEYLFSLKSAYIK